MATSSSGSVSTTSTSGISISGIGSGLDINSIVDALVNSEAIPQTQLKNQVTTHTTMVSAYQTLNTKMAAVRDAAQNLNIPFQWKLNKATSNDSSVSATADSSAVTGSMSFVVKKLAAAQVAASYGTVASTDTVVGTGSLLLGTTGALGLSNVKGSGLSTGSHTIEVTQASAGASQSGTAIGNSVTLTGSETIEATVNGVAKTYTLTAGTYNQQQLSQMISNVSGGDVNATVNADKSLKLTTTREGSAASLELTGGTGLSALGLSASGSASNGIDGIVKVDGVSNTVSDIRPGGGNTVVLNSTAGTITTGFSGGLRTGTSTMKNIDLGDGKLSTVVNAINNAGAGVSAAAVQVAPGQYKLQLQSTTTGTAGAIGIDTNAFASTLGTIDDVTPATDAEIQMGTGATAYTVKSSSNSVSGVMPGVTLQLSSADPSKTVTVTVGGDTDKLATNLQTLVDSVNDALKFINDNSKYDSDSGTAGIFLGDSTTRSLQQSLMSAMGDIVGGSGSLKAMGSAGITLQDDGSLKFDKDTFTSNYSKDPNSVVGLFIEGGLVGGSTGTHPGIAERVAKLGNSAVNSVSGSITTVINGEKSTISDLNDQIDSWTTRLDAYRAMLVQQYSAMDSAVSSFKSQGSWLSQQLASL